MCLKQVFDIEINGHVVCSRFNNHKELSLRSFVLTYVSLQIYEKSSVVPFRVCT